MTSTELDALQKKLEMARTVATNEREHLRGVLEDAVNDVESTFDAIDETYDELRKALRAAWLDAVAAEARNA